MGDYKHYFIIGFDHKNRVYGVDFVNPKDNEMRQFLTLMKNANVPFTHRIWFSNQKDISLVLKDKQCEFQNIIILKNLNELIAKIK